MDRDGMMLEGSEDSSSDSDADMEPLSNAAQQSTPQKAQPIIDEDGFQLVQSRKPGRGR